jgi:hypothetical protein
MKYLLTIVLIIFFIQNCFSQLSDTIQINFCKGIDYIEIFKSTRNEVKTFRNLQYTTVKQASHVDTRFGPYYKKSRIYVNDSLKLTFIFETKRKKSISIFHQEIRLFVNIRFAKKRLEKIVIRNNNAILNKEIQIGRSTKQDVVKLFGQNGFETNPKYVSYEINGVTTDFSFSDNGYLHEITIKTNN